MKNNKITIIALLLSAITSSSYAETIGHPVNVDESTIKTAPIDDYKITIGAKPWQAETHFDYSFNSSSANHNYGNPTSELNFKNMKSSGLTIAINAENKESYHSVEFSIGKGSGSNGIIIDDDYYSQDYVGAGNPTRFSRTESDSKILKSYAFKYANGLIFRPNNSFITDARLGMGISVSQDTFEADGLIVLEDPYSRYKNSMESSVGRVIYNSSIPVLKLKTQTLLNSIDLEWNKKWQNGFSVKLKTDAVYLGLVRTYDHHIKRSDLGDPSFVITTFNYGAKSDLSFAYTIEDLSFSLGANYMYLRPYGYGTAEVFDETNTSEGGIPMINHNISRIGYYAGVSYQF